MSGQITALVVLALSLPSLALVIKFKREEIGRARLKIAEKIWGGKSPDEVLAKRFKLFVLLMILFIAVSTLIKQVGVTLPNFEMIIPILVVVGSFSPYCESTKFWRYLTRYLGVVALISVYVIYLVYEGLHSIYIFTWSGFIIAWLLGMKNKLSMFDRFPKLLWRTTLTAAAAIIIFDLYTGVLGWSLLTPTGLIATSVQQIPFTLFHFSSLIFVPPLVGLAKVMIKVKVPVLVAVAARSRVRTRERW